MKNRLILSGIVAIALLAFAACSKDVKNSDGNGILKISVTDAPFPVEFIEEANVTIIKIEMREKDVEDDHYPFITVYEDTTTLNLLELRNGVSETLTSIEVPAGNYDLVRLYVEDASITVKDHGTYSMKVPSGAQTGIKVFIDPGIRVESGITSDLLLDFDLGRSFVLKGNMNSPAGIKGFNFKPVIRAVNNTTAGQVRGYVKDTSEVYIPSAEVWIKADTTIATAYTDTTNGFYAIPGIPAGFYTLYATKQDYDTVIVNDIEVIAGNFTNVDFELTPKN